MTDTIEKRLLKSRLIEAGLIKYGLFELSSGGTSKTYVDLRALIGHPETIRYVVNAYLFRLAMHGYPDLIAGVPYGSLPLASVISYTSCIPLIYLRKEHKAHGTGRELEGVWTPNQQVTVIDDVLTTGNSILRTVSALQRYGLSCNNAIVMVDREQGGVERLAERHVHVESIMTLSDLED